MKTEDLSYLKNSNNEISVNRNVMKNVLSFLKTNTTKIGHTYCLFKGM